MQRGEVYRFKVPTGVGHEQQAERYGVVVQSDDRRIGQLTAAGTWAVDDALLTLLGLD